MLCGSRKPIVPEVLLTVGLTRVPGGGLGLQICSQTIRNVSGVFWEANVSRSRYNLSAGALGNTNFAADMRGGGGRAGGNTAITAAMLSSESYKYESNGRLHTVCPHQLARESICGAEAPLCKARRNTPTHNSKIKLQQRLRMHCFQIWLVVGPSGCGSILNCLAVAVQS